MIGRASCIVGAIALFAGAAALAQPPAGGDPALKARKDDPNRMVCRNLNEGGSRLDRRRACHTVSEWAEMRRQTRQTIDHMQNSRASN
jgi:hypothetical protein